MWPTQAGKIQKCISNLANKSVFGVWQQKCICCWDEGAAPAPWPTIWGAATNTFSLGATNTNTPGQHTFLNTLKYNLTTTTHPTAAAVCKHPSTPLPLPPSQVHLTLSRRKTNQPKAFFSSQPRISTVHLMVRGLLDPAVEADHWHRSRRFARRWQGSRIRWSWSWIGNWI